MKRLVRAAGESAPLLLFLDFDGTLVRLQSDPEKVRITRAGKRCWPGSPVVFRRPSFPAGLSKTFGSRVNLPGLAWAGNHGLEVRQGRTVWLHPEAKRTIPVLKKILREAKRRLKHIPGVWIDDKGLSASVHFRRAQTARAPEIQGILREIVPTGSGRLKLTEGKKVYEIRPAVAWDKGKAVLCLMDRLDPQGRATPVYLGDDRTDEDAFRALAGRGLTVCIGGRRPTAAQYRLPDVAAVWRFLQALYLL